MFDASINIRVRYAETDQMGMVYYGNYATYYEVARVEALRQIGFRYKELEEEGIIMPVIENNSKFIQPALYDELLTVRVLIKKLPGIKTIFNYEFTNESGTLIHKGETILVFLDNKTRKPCRPPSHLIQLLTPYFSAR
jgi:acyl-CoA thioester hydrolase